MASNAAKATSYDARMRRILRLRRVGNVSCIFIAIYALGWVFLGFNSTPSLYSMMVSSLIAFIFAIVVAVNVMTFLLR